VASGGCGPHATATAIVTSWSATRSPSLTRTRPADDVDRDTVQHPRFDSVAASQILHHIARNDLERFAQFTSQKVWNLAGLLDEVEVATALRRQAGQQPFVEVGADTER
jgi:hypothetical protein